MQKTDIEYLSNVWNFYTGCRHTTKVCPCADKCWARGMAHRFGRSFEPTLHPEKLLEPLSLRKPSRIGVCFTGELFGDWVNPFTECGAILDHHQTKLDLIIRRVMFMSPQHQFFFLTKNPRGYLKWGEFPDNAYIGATVCNPSMMDKALLYFTNIKAEHKWLSIEPLMESLAPLTPDVLRGISWVVIGGWSNKADYKKYPITPDWIREIITACNYANIPIWIKNNLLKDNFLDLRLTEMRQEFPK